MNNNLKMLIGATVGGAIGYFIANVVIEIIYLREQTDTREELDTIDDGYGGVTEDEFAEKETFKRPTKMSTNKRDYTKKFVADDRPEIQALIRKYETGETTEESLESDENVNKEIDREYEESMRDLESPDEVDVPTDPSIISMAEYAANDENFETVTLHYFEDDVVTDENRNPIAKPEKLLGEEALFEFGEDDTVYVRNRAKRCLYEVIRLNQDFAATPLSIQDKRKRALKQEEENASEDHSH